MNERFAENLVWYYHSIPFITSLLSLIIGTFLVQTYGPLAKTIFPPMCLIIGGYGGLILLGEISKQKNKL
jgi:hypothetical protein